MGKSSKSWLKGITLAACAFALVLSGSTTQASADTTEKLQAAIEQMSAEQQAALYLLLSELTGGSSSGGASSGPLSAEDAFNQNLKKIETALKNIEDMETEEALDLIMEGISDDFEYYQVGDKDDLRDFLEGAFDMGYIEMYGPDTEIITDDTEIEVDGDSATVYPIEVEGPWGGATLEFECQREDGTWRIIGLDISGI